MKKFYQKKYPVSHKIFIFTNKIPVPLVFGEISKNCISILAIKIKRQLSYRVAQTKVKFRPIVKKSETNCLYINFFLHKLLYMALTVERERPLNSRSCEKNIL